MDTMNQKQTQAKNLDWYNKRVNKVAHWLLPTKEKLLNSDDLADEVKQLLTLLRAFGYYPMESVSIMILVQLKIFEFRIELYAK